MKNLLILLILLLSLKAQDRQDLIITYGGSAKTSGINYKTSFSIGQPIVGSHSATNNSGSFGFWSFFLLEPQPPLVTVSEGDFPDRVELKWDVDVLSPVAAEGFKIYRDGNLVGRADATAGSFTDFDVIPGELYKYEITGLNKYGEGNAKPVVGFVNPNGIITGSVTTSSGQPSRGVDVTLSPNLGKSLDFSNLAVFSFPLDSSFKNSESFAISMWFKPSGNTQYKTLLTLHNYLNFFDPKLITATLNNRLYIGSSDGNTPLWLESIDISGMENQWHSATFSYLDSTNTLSTFFDGQLYSEIQIAKIPLDTGQLNVTLGGYGYDGGMDNVSLWRKNLSKDDIEKFRKLTLSGNEESLIAYYKFDEGRGSKLYDLTENSYDTKSDFIKWSNDIPPVKIGAVTDDIGNYIIEGINYESGTSFTVTANKKTPVGRSIKLNPWTPEVQTYIKLQGGGDVDFINGPYTLERWAKPEGGDWNHYTFSWDGATPKWYINGLPALSGNPNLDNVPDEFFIVDNDTTFATELGKTDSIISIYSFAAMSNFAPTYYDEIRVWNVARSEAQVQANFNKMLDEGENLILNFKLNDGGGVASKSTVGNPNLARFYGAFEWSTDIPLDEYFIHKFNPSARTVTLNTSNTATDGVQFTDISLMKVSGYVNYVNTECYQDSVQFLVNGTNDYDNVITDKNGYFELELSPGGTYKIEPYYKKRGDKTDHTFANKKTGQSFITVGPLFGPVSGIQIENTRTRNLTVRILGGYDNDSSRVNIGQFEVNIRSKDGCFDKNYTISEIVNTIASLPPVDFIVSPAPSANNIHYFTDVQFDALARDLELNTDTATFQYNADMAVAISTDEFYNHPTANVFILNQNATYKYKVFAYEWYYDAKNNNQVVGIPIPKAIVNIYDDISGITRSNLQLNNGVAEDILLKPGFPNITSGGEHPYQKKLEAVVVRDNGQSRSDIKWAYIEGLLPKGNTFASIAPLTPFMILHDPPGDVSSASIEKNKSYSATYSYGGGTEETDGNTTGIGVDQEIFSFLGLGGGVINDILDIENSTDIHTTVTQNHSNSQAYDVTVSFSEKISTSSNPLFVGPAADVMMGFAQNFIYGKADSLKITVEGSTVIPSIKEKVTFQPGEIKTMYLYTRQHISETLIPELQSLAANSDTPETKIDSLNIAIRNWKAFLAFNESNTKNALDPVSGVNLENNAPFKNSVKSLIDQLTEKERQISITKTDDLAKLNQLHTEYRGIKRNLDSLMNQTRLAKNISLDAGANYEYSTSRSYTTAKNWTQMSQGFDGLDNETNVSAGPVSISTKFISGSSNFTEYGNGNSTNIGQTFSYSLADDDNGDYFSISVKEDPVFGSPVFELYSGTSMNPWNEGTKARNGLDISIENSEILNIDPTGKGSTKLLVSNVSPTNETQTYRLVVDQTSNPDGAIVAINGIIVEQYIDLDIPANTSFNLTLTVERGPKKYSYNDIKLIFMADGEIENFPYVSETQTFKTVFNQADSTYTKVYDNVNYFYKEITFDAHFLEPVSEIELFEPDDNFLVNKSSNDSLWVTITGYDTTKTFFEKVKIQYRNHISSVGKRFSEADLNSANKANTNPWILFTEITRDSLTRNNKHFLRFPFISTGLADGIYELRAVTISSNPDVLDGSSEILKGIIDVNGPIVLGIPSPVDGVLNADDEVRIRFNEDIDQSKLTPARISVVNTETDEFVNYYLAKSARELVFTFDINSNQYIENKRLRITIDSLYDIYGNVHEDAVNNSNKINFEFLVDRNPIRWVGGDITEAKFTNQSVEFTRQLTNTGDLSQFNIENIPSWLQVSPRSGTLQKDEFVTITFKLSSDLVLGAYDHTIFASTNMGDEPLKIDLRNLIRPPVWEVIPSDFEFSMVLLSELYIDSTLSQDSYDVVGVFENDNLVGVAQIEPREIQGNTKYFAFLTIYSNRTQHSDLNFRIWDSSEGRILGNLESPIPFTANMILGTILSPKKLYASKDIFNEYSMEHGWNWVSFNLGVSHQPSVTLKGVKDNIVQVKDHTRFLTYDANYGFVGSLDSILSSTAYLVKLKSTDTLKIIGKPIDLNNTVLNLKKGWNAISYLPQKSLDVDKALENIIKRDGDLIKSQNQFAMYLNGTGWVGSLTYMHPGLGYYLKSDYGVQSFTYPTPVEQSKAKAAAPSQSEAVVKTDGSKTKINFNAYLDQKLPHWKNNAHDYPNTMSLILDIDVNELDVKNKENIIVGVFKDDNPLGVGVLESIGNTKTFSSFVSISGDEDLKDELEVRVMNMENNKGFILEDKLSFRVDDVLGTVNQPLVFSKVSGTLDNNGRVPREFSLAQNFPNPFNPVTTIKYSLKENSKVSLRIYNALGQLVRTLVNENQELGVKEVQWNGLNDYGRQVSSGVYFYKLISGSDVRTKKMVFLK
jgi:hypothetical protein